MRTGRTRVGAGTIALLLCWAAPTWGQTPEPSAMGPGLTVAERDAGYALALDGGVPFHETVNDLREARLIDVADSPVRLVLWEEVAVDGFARPYYAISLEGRTVNVVRPTSYVLKLRHGEFDPLLGVPASVAAASARPAGLYLVQFVTQPLEAFREAIRARGGVVHQFVAGHAHFVQMTPEVRDAVAGLPFVRWVGVVPAEYKLEEVILDQLERGAVVEPRRYSIMLYERGATAQAVVSEFIESLGGKVEGTTPLGFRVEATLSLEQVRLVAGRDEVMFIDRKGPLELDMDIVREIGGANYVETVAGYTGQGVRAEVADSEIDIDHPEWSAPPIVHVAGSSVNHGTSVYGILFAQGTDPQARGLIPDGVGIFAYSDGLLGGGTTRYTHTAELVDPAGPYRTVLQTNSTGDSQTTAYTTISAEMDDLLFQYDIVLTQSQSNTGTRDSRPQAWAKNIISGGAVEHYNTLTRSDDCWCGQASIGPADDGRIKPDLCFFYDDTYAPSAGGGYTEFGGTSGATPSIAGHVGLFFQMWSEGIFGNEVDPAGTVFENRCHMTTAKAVMINTATQYPFSGTSHDLTRVHQGWGMPSVQYLYDMRDNISIIDESEVIHNLETLEYSAYVEPGEPELRATLVYADPMGVPAASVDRINDLTLKITSPSGTIYWGNNGLLAGNWSTSGGSANTVDTVENVFIQAPESGVWTVEIIASEINQDAHVETPEVDADFALVVSGAFLATCTSDGRIQLDRNMYPCEGQATIRVVDCDLNTNDELVESVTVTINSTSEPAGESVVLTETAPETSDFRGTIALSMASAEGVLQVAGGDLVTAVYEDADDGTGSPATVEDTAPVDCQPPVISNVQVADLGPFDAVITFETDEPTLGSVRYGESCGALTETARQAGYGTEHSVGLAGLQEDHTYFFVVDAEDEAGNLTTEDNAGACLAFSTPDIPLYYTEQFGGHDLDDLMLIFEPNGTIDFYGGCVEEIAALPTDPAGGTTISLSDDDSEQITLAGGQSVWLYGESYTSIWICSNGYVTLGQSDTDYDETLAEHFEVPRVAALYDDLNPSSGGTVSYRQLGDRLAVTWENVPEYNTSNSNTFQIELFFDGSITISHLTTAGSDAIVGLSAGEGLPVGFYQTDLSEMGACGPKPPVAHSGQAGTAVSVATLITLSADDDGLPDPPAQLTYIVESLPEHGTLHDPNDGAILSVPFTLASSGNQVIFDPTPGYEGPDNFTFKANDGGVAPEGGDSETATITIAVGGSAWTPVAYAVSASTQTNVPVVVELLADDPNGDPLVYTIESLPALGHLSDPSVPGVAIEAVPHDLPGRFVNYHPPCGLLSQESFSFSASDATATSNEAGAAVTVNENESRKVFEFTFDVDPGWSTEGDWEYGPATAGGSHNGDPAAAHTGTNIYGYNLGGDYANFLPVRYLTTQALDCSRMSSVELRFWRWLGVESYPGYDVDHATVEVSGDGAFFDLVWENSGESIDDDHWNQMVLDLSASADGQETMYVRWGMGPTDNGVTYPGWNLDDVEVWGIVETAVADFNTDALIDLADAEVFAQCLAGPDEALSLSCLCVDLDGDGDVDLADYAEFQTAFTE